MTILATGPRMAGILSARVAPSILTLPINVYANTLSPIIPDIFAAMDVVSRELVGFLPSVGRAPDVERAAVGQTVKIPVASAVTVGDVIPSMTIAEPNDHTFGNGMMAITKSRQANFGFTGEEQRAVNTGGPGYLTARGMIVANALRALVNEAETDLAVEAVANASRAWGTSGTTPFATGLTDTAQLRKILDDNGAPRTGRSLVVDTTTAANILTLPNLTRVNEAGTQMTLRQGELMDIHGFSIKDSQMNITQVKGTAAGATTSAAGFAKGATVIALASAGTGTIKAGDVIMFAGDTRQYLVVAGDADVSNGGTITIATPGLMAPIPAVATAITVTNSYTAAGAAFTQDALWIAMRPPAVPEEGDAAADRILLTDPYSGITFEFSVWLGNRKVRYEVALAWGVKATKPAHIALLKG